MVVEYRRDWIVPGSPYYQLILCLYEYSVIGVEIRAVFVSVLSSHSCSVEYYFLYLVCLCSLYEVSVIIFQSFLISGVVRILMSLKLLLLEC